DNRPHQGDYIHPHLLGVKRGAADKGMPVMTCKMCHQETNNKYSGVPGAPHWQLAPASMAWQGLSDSQIGTFLKDQAKNGSRSLEDLYKHMTEDPLVQWAWQPGENRTTPPLTQQQFASALREWIDNGAIVP
ncbi:MAG: hypothetical protein ACRCVT_00825, partial [Leadbetterella sp.]